MGYYPVQLELKGKEVVVIGGGKIAQRRITGIIETGANITVISPNITLQLNDYVQLGKILWKKKNFAPADLQHAFLIIAATDQAQVNLEVKKAASPDQLINLVDSPDESNFILPSVVRQGKLIMTVSTSGASPILAKKIRQEIAGQYGSEYKDYVDFLFSCRKRVLQEITNPEVKQHVLTVITDPAFLNSHNREKDFADLIKKYI